MKVAIVTGASSGIGWEAALEIDRRFRSLDEIWIVGRNEEKLRILSRHLKHANRIVIMDVTDPEDMDAELEVEKTITSTAPTDGYKIGDEITYKVTVTNTGNVTITGIELKDTLVELDEE